MRRKKGRADPLPETNIDLTRVRNRSSMMKILFLVSMVVAASIFGTLAFEITTTQEEDTAIQTYESIAHSALEEAQAIALRKQHGAESLAMLLSHAFPSASQWPFVGLRGYTQIATRVAALSNAEGHGFLTIVDPDQIEPFEAHASQLYQEYEYPESAGWSDFGFGIYGIDPSLGTRFHDTGGGSTWKSRHDILVPFLQHMNTFDDPSLLMRNLHQSELLGKVIESIIDCAKVSDPNATLSPDCGGVTNFTEGDAGKGASAMFFTPVFPADDPASVVGFIATPIDWEEVLTKIVPDYLDGLDCIVSTGLESYTYTIMQGRPNLNDGKGDFHSPRYEKYARSVTLSNENTGTVETATFTLTLYPTEVMFDTFETSIPIITSVGFVAVIFVCIVIFFVYDYFMQHVAHQQRLILDMKRRFVRFISHEVRTPMNVVCMGLDLLQTELKDRLLIEKMRVRGEGLEDDSSNCDTKDGTEAIVYVDYLFGLTQEIMENSHNAVSVLNDLLNYDKIESKNFAIEKNRVVIWSSLKRTVHEFSIQARNRHIELGIELKDAVGQSISFDELASSEVGNLLVLGDERRLCQVFRNLISNALKFTPERKNVTVAVTYRPDGLPNAAPIDVEESDSNEGGHAALHRQGSIVIRVTDEGVGLSRDQQRLLFKEGVQFNASILQAGGGSGLGLCIAKEIVELHQGTILAESDGLGSGTSFQVELPLYQAPLGETVKSLTEMASLQSNTQNRFVLVVDDVLTNTKMLVRLLERAGHECITAKNGEEAINAYETNLAALESDDMARPIDTILMDFEMPRMNGPDATRRLREMGCTCFIFGVTGNVLVEDVTTFRKSGADLVIFKPINLNAIEESWEKMEMISSDNYT